MLDLNNLIVYSDGSINPERSGAGGVLCTPHGQIVAVTNKLLPMMTNNEAEYEGLLLVMDLALHYKATAIEARLDSEIVVYQMIGRYAVNSAKLKRLHTIACDMARRFQKVRYVHIPRRQNVIADALATEASAGRRWRMIKR